MRALPAVVALYDAYCSVQTSLVPVMKTGIPCAHILTGKTCFNHRKTCSHYRDPVLLAGNLPSKQGVSCILPVLPYMGLQCITSLNQFTDVRFNSFLSGPFIAAMARTYLQLPLRQRCAGNVYLLVLSS